MKTSLVLLPISILCIMLVASGCTSTSPAGTATPVATPVASPAATGQSTPIATLSGTPSTTPLTWSGTWNSTWLERNGNRTVSELDLTQKGSDVAGTYRFTYPGEGAFTGSLNASVQGRTLAGMYAESDNDTGFFVFDLAETGNSFTGRWVHAANRSELENSTLFWNGVRE